MKQGIKIGIGILLFSVSLLLFFCPNIRELQMSRTVDQTIEQFQAAQETTGQSESDALYQQLQAYNQSLTANGQTLTDAWDYEQAPITVEYMPSDGIIGYIEIPDMDVRLPLLLGASEENMAKGAAVLSQTSMPIGGESTNCVIAGHRGYRGSPYFRNIQRLQVGSAVYITNPWETLEYTVMEIQIILPSDLDAVLIRPGQDMVTLLTCHPYASQGEYRYVVYCQRADTVTQEQLSLAEDNAQNNVYLTDQAAQSDTYMQIEDTLRIALPAAVAAVILAALVLRFIKRRKQ